MGLRSFEYGIIIITPIFWSSERRRREQNFWQRKKYEIADFEKKSIKKYESKIKYKKKYKSMKKV